MAATTGYQTGFLMALSVDVSGTLKKFANGKATNLSFAPDFAEVTNSNSTAKAKEFLKTLSEWSCEFEGVFEEDTSIGSTEISFKDLLEYAQSDNTISVSMSTGITDNIKFTGSAFVGPITFNAPIDGAMTFTCSVKGTGPLTPGVVV